MGHEKIFVRKKSFPNAPAGANRPGHQKMMSVKLFPTKQYHLFRASFALLQILLGGGEHEFDSVELVDFAGAGIVVDGYDVGGRICLPQSLDNALTYHVVRQAAEGLGTYDVRYAFLDQFHHLTGQEPSLTGLVADGYDRFRIGDDLVNAGRRIKAFTAEPRRICSMAQIPSAEIFEVFLLVPKCSAL